LARIYTGTGDDGTTGLIGGRRVSKDSPYIEAGGSLDELNALLGVVRSYELPDRVDSVLQRVQSQLFLIGAELAAPEGIDGKVEHISNKEIQNLESDIDAFEDCLQPLRQFILPGGTLAGAQLHLARTVARRTERQCVALSRTETVNPGILRYLNRLSDLCFVLARYVNLQQSASDLFPSFG
jgi:cob(I)alamin adenosyltransferase